jgi:hypothetical protein
MGLSAEIAGNQVSISGWQATNKKPGNPGFFIFFLCSD